MTERKLEKEKGREDKEIADEASDKLLCISECFQVLIYCGQCKT